MIRLLDTRFVRRRAHLASWLLSVCVVGSACEGTGGAGGLWDVPEVSRQIIRPWLYCSDCTDGELARITAKGATMVPYLSSALLDGPPHTDDSLAQRRAMDAVNRLRQYRTRHNETLTPADSAAFVQRQHDSFVLTYRLRAAQALRTIDPIRAASDVAQLCQLDPPEMSRQPVFKGSFKAIGVCP